MSFYESKGFHHGQAFRYQESKEVLNMQVSEFKELLQCMWADADGKAALVALSEDPGIENETVFQWLKRNNIAGREGDEFACRRTSWIARCFWRGRLGCLSGSFSLRT